MCLHHSHIAEDEGIDARDAGLFLILSLSISPFVAISVGILLPKTSCRVNCIRGMARSER